MGVLKAKVNGEWVAVPGSNAASEEVAVGPNDPGFTYDLWYDTTASGSASPTAKWAPPATLARPIENTTINETWGKWVHDRQVDGALQFMGQYVGASWTVPVAGTFQTIPLNVIDVNVGSCWQPATYEWKAPKAGWIEVSGSICLVPNPNVPGNCFYSFFKNTKEHRFGQLHMTTGNVGTFQTSGTRPIQVAVNDLIKLTVNTTFAGSTVYINGDFSFMSIRYLSTT